MGELGFTPNWPAPEGVRSFITYRMGGVSENPYGTFNLATHVGDSPDSVAANRKLLDQHLGLPEGPLWLIQAHGNAVVDVESPENTVADGSFSTQAGKVCAVLTADCLPILLCGRGSVAALHCGWRGLAHGMIAQGVKAFPQQGEEILAYLGPAISAKNYEVSEAEVAAFAKLPSPKENYARPNPARQKHYFLDLYAIARIQLAQYGVTAIYGGESCTFRQSSQFYSYRRDGETGRMASLIWLE